MQAILYGGDGDLFSRHDTVLIRTFRVLHVLAIIDVVRRTSYVYMRG